LEIVFYTSNNLSRLSAILADSPIQFTALCATVEVRSILCDYFTPQKDFESIKETLSFSPFVVASFSLLRHT
jgi:hypothetical protein